MTEKQLWHRIKKLLPGIAERVENVATAGMPDVYGEHVNGSYWVELKVDALERNDLNLNHNQLPWVVRHLRHGAVVFVASWNSREKRTDVYRVSLNKSLQHDKKILFYRQVSFNTLAGEIERRAG